MTTPTVKFKPPSEMPVLENSVPIIRYSETASVDSPHVSELLVANQDDVADIRRLVVLVPSVEMDDVQIAREIWELAAPPHLAVLFLGLCSDISEESQMRRRLATLAALTRDPRITVESQLEYGKNFIRHIKTIQQNGDVIVCHAEQQIGFGNKHLSKALEKAGASVWTLSGFYSKKNSLRSQPLAGVIFWSISILILAIFFWFQAQTLRLTVNWAKNTLLYASVFTEVGLLWVWHKISS